MEVDNLKSQRNSKIAQKERKEQEKVTAAQNVERLKAAYRQVHSAIEQARTLKKEIKDKEDPGDEWKGTNAEKYTDYVSGAFKGNYDAYINHLDGIQDDINSELTRNENKVLELNGDILGLARAINSLWNQIQNWVN